ncbi:TauD/TfdA family dioxygenase [uncultured Nocardioides sp.]|uniref:TauD/TfdA family dioxygenase n=1 Tax=uncultured Nocardioides sp. TaxID=198441 RepID=UPI00261025D5|nr:TauD/TfdA family dioxygenase [uncultured Nocardioides sp.]
MRPLTSDVAWLPAFVYNHTEASELATHVAEAVTARGVARVAGFPGDANELVAFLAMVGPPLTYYGGDTGSHPDQAAVWRVRYEHEASLRGETHALEGPLAVHSSQSLLEPRPHYFCMLMVNPGWQDNERGFNGESLLAPWAEAFKALDEENPDYDDLLHTLMNPIPFPDGIARPLAYRLDDAYDDHDLGVRLKSGLLAYLRDSQPGTAALAATERFVDAARRTARTVQMAAGDLVVLDNDRWGHGRHSVIGRRRDAKARVHTNPRELWSLTLQ